MAVVTGASRGIGRAIVDELVAEGVHVVGGSRSAGNALAGEDVLGVSVDLSTADGPATLVRTAVDAHGGIDFVVNNAGAARLHLEGGFAEATDEDWQWAFETNFLSAVRTIRAALPHLKERRGAIVNVSSLNAREPAAEAPEYSAFKAALSNLSRSLAVELGPHGVRVNAVSPGPMLTDMQTGFAAELGVELEAFPEGASATVALKRFGEPKEIAAMVVALLSDRFGYVTATDVVVDGGCFGA